MFRKVLVLNRGEIACRIIRTLKRLGIRSVAVYSEADAQSLHVLQADEAFCLSGVTAKQTYLDAPSIMAVLAACEAEAVHPGYGFLSESAAFARSVESAGVCFIGPTPTQLEQFGLKHRARELAATAGVPLTPGSPVVTSIEAAQSFAERIGYPVMLKSSAGGGGIGMFRVADPGELPSAFESVARLGQNNFDNAAVFIEKFVDRARHIEVQVFGDGRGHVVSLGERDCSVQRRNQKVIEETPAPGLGARQRAALSEAALRLMRSVNYSSAGTVEFIYDSVVNKFYFLEVNTRLQVEHTVTEEVTGVDLVEWMIRHAAGDPLPELLTYQHRPRGHSIQARIYAEVPAENFRPSSGLVTRAAFPREARVETWIETGVEVSGFYDPMVAKVIVHGTDRSDAVRRLRAALDETTLLGIETNVDYLRKVVTSDGYQRGAITTRTLTQLHARGRGIAVEAPGALSTIQDYPGRVGYWNVGIPPSGPMDARSFALGNRVVGNPAGAAALELTLNGPTLRFHEDVIFALSGAVMPATLRSEPVEYYTPLFARAGDTLEVGAVQGAGMRTYLCVRGGLRVAPYLGSMSTFTLGGFGGHGGRALRVGDVLHVHELESLQSLEPPQRLPPELRTPLSHDWELLVVYGPHAAPDFFTKQDMDEFFSSTYRVHYNSARTGVRLVGPKPHWARPDGGEAGLHPSNIHDCAYTVGAVDFTGDMPILLGPDGPSLGGFVCPATVIRSELYKLGQLRPGDRVHFTLTSYEQAELAFREQSRAIEQRRASEQRLSTTSSGARERNARHGSLREAVLYAGTGPSGIDVVCRQSGDHALLLEFGPPVLDLNLRFVAHAMGRWLQQQDITGLGDLTPGIRSLQVQFDDTRVSRAELLQTIVRGSSCLPAINDMVVSSRIVRLPLAWDDSQTRLAIQKYTQLVRADAPWAPSNIEFIRRMNGLDDVEEVRRIVFDASYLVMGLGDVYLGAPVATPLDPRHRLVTTKYNPARTWTPENAVGIGGAYLCIYGMEGPGGYQFVGRTLQVYNRFRATHDFLPGQPWLLRCFDQIRFYPVTEPELLEMRRAFAAGRLQLETKDQDFALAEYNGFLSDNQASIRGFKHKQASAFEQERQRWAAAGHELDAQPELTTGQSPVNALTAEQRAVTSPVPGSVWKIHAAAGERLRRGQPLLVLESMKMEIVVECPHDGILAELRCSEGSSVDAGGMLAILDV